MKIFYAGEIEVNENFTYIRTDDGKQVLIDEAFFKALGEKKFIGEIKIEINEIPTGLNILDEGVEAND